MDNASRLLILDDDPSVAMTIAAIARLSGFEVRHFEMPEPFFAELAQWQPSHVAVDLVMPTLDGGEVLRQMAERGSRARVIVTSGMGSQALEEARSTAAAQGLIIAGVLPKPFRAQQLRDLLQST